MQETIESCLSDLLDAGFSGILEVGEPNTRVLDVPIERDHLGIVVIGGTNPMAVVQEYGISIDTSAMSRMISFKEMSRIEDLVLNAVLIFFNTSLYSSHEFLQSWVYLSGFEC